MLGVQGAGHNGKEFLLLLQCEAEYDK